MTVSNEPGYYQDGAFGIRIESIVIVREAKLAHDFGKKGWLRFERVTMVCRRSVAVHGSLTARRRPFRLL
jgi:Xaa-Pro aminopeptidase